MVFFDIVSSITLKVQFLISFWTAGFLNLTPINLLLSNIVDSRNSNILYFALVLIKILLFEKETFDGILLSPLILSAIISTFSFLIIATHEYLVPKSIPIIGSF